MEVCFNNFDWSGDFLKTTQTQWQAIFTCRLFFSIVRSFRQFLFNWMCELGMNVVQSAPGLTSTNPNKGGFADIIL